MNYPISESKRIQEFERLFPQSANERTLDIIKMHIAEVNEAYKQGFKDGVKSIGINVER